MAARLSHRSRTLAIVMATLLMATALLAPQPTPATAAPGDDDAAATGDTAAPADDTAAATSDTGTLDLRLLGSASSFTLPGQQSTYPITLPVPDGTTPAALRGQVTVPPWVTGGDLDVWQGDRMLSRIALTRAPNTPFTLPLDGITVDRSGRAAGLTLRSYLRTDGFCAVDPDEGLTITGAGVTYAGTETPPASVAAFLGPILRTLTLYVPAEPTRDEGAAAVTLSAAVVARYGTAPVAVRTVALPSGASGPEGRPAPFERRIVVDSDAPEGLALGPGGRYLTLGGDGAALLTQAQLLTSDLSAIALSSTAIAGTLRPAPQLPRDVQTLADIGVPATTVSTTSVWPSVRIGINQALLGRPSKNIRVQITGSHTPVESGRISVRAGDRVIDAWDAEPGGGINHWVAVPDDVLARYTELRVTLETGGANTECGTQHRAALTVSGSGEISAERADPPIPAGFQSLPQALMPRTQLAWTRGDVADVRRAVSIVAGLQRLSTIPLGIDVVDPDALLGSRQPGILIAADGEGTGALPLPFTSDGGTLTVTGPDGEQSLRTDPAVRSGSLQVARGSGRTVLVATSSGAPALLDEALTWLDADPDRWATVSGGALIQTADAAPVFLPAASAPQESGGSGVLGTALAWTAGIAALIALAIGLTLLVRRRRTAGEQSATDE